MTKPIDPDIKALKAAAKALKGSTSSRMLEANLTFLCDYFLWHPSRAVPARLKAR